MVKNNISYLIIIVLFIYIVLMHSCNGDNKEFKDSKTVVTEVIVTKTDTIYVDVVKKNLPIYILDSIRDTIYINKDVIPNGLDTFYSGIDDSLISALVTVYASERPFIDFDYKIKTFNTTTEKTIKERVIVNNSKSYLSIGGVIYGNEYTFGAAPLITYNHKRGNTYGIFYDVLNKNIGLTFTKKISFRKN